MGNNQLADPPNIAYTHQRTFAHSDVVLDLQIISARIPNHKLAPIHLGAQSFLSFSCLEDKTDG
jgi:hypothetical protein